MSKYEPTGDFRLIDNATGEQIGASAFEADSAFEAETARRTTMTMGPKDAGWDEYDAAADAGGGPARVGHGGVRLARQVPQRPGRHPRRREPGTMSAPLVALAFTGGTR